MGDMKRKAAGIGYTVLAWSRDGRTWQRDHEVFIPQNPVPGSWDHANAWGGDQVIVDDETYLYYAGYARGHKVDRYNERQIGVAIMPRDRYVAREADMNTGTLITKPLTLDGSHITINADVRGEMQVRLLDQDRNPLPGFGWLSISGDSIDHIVKWEKDLKSLNDKTVIIEFKFKFAQLYGFYLYD
jgi:hypothetical protein